MSAYTITELQEIITELKAAMVRAIKSGGVTSYTINSGQSSTTVQQASLSSIKNELAYFTQLLNEELEYGSGSHCTYIRGTGLL